jgi:hypothetical protein
MAQTTVGCLSDPTAAEPKMFKDKAVREARYLIDVGVFDYDFANSMSEGNVGVVVIFTAAGEERTHLCHC